MHTSARYHASRGADAMISQRYNRLDFFGHCQASIADDAMISRRCRGFYNIGQAACGRSEFCAMHCIENEICALHLYRKEYPNFKKRSALQCGHAGADAMISRRCRAFYNIGRAACGRSEFNKIHCIENEICALHLYCKEYPTFKKRSALQWEHAGADAKAEIGSSISDAGCQIV